MILLCLRSVSKSGAHAVANINWNVGVSIDDVEVLWHGRVFAVFAAGIRGIWTLETKSEGLVEMHQTPLPHTHTGLVEDFRETISKRVNRSGVRVNRDYRTNAIIAQIM